MKPAKYYLDSIFEEIIDFFINPSENNLRFVQNCLDLGIDAAILTEIGLD